MKGLKPIAVGVCLSLALIIGLMPIMSGCAPSGGGAGEGEGVLPEAEYTWRMGNAWTQVERNKSMQLFADLIYEYTNGRVEVEFYPGGTLGTHDEMFHAVMDGSVEMGNLCPYVHLLPGGMMNWMPWTIGTYDEAAFAVQRPDGVIYNVMTDAYHEVGVELLWFTPMGPYGIGCKERPIKAPEDFKDLKFRVSGSLGFVCCVENMSEGTGMTLETIPWADLYNALERGVVDACWSLWGSLIEERHYEVLKYYTDLGFGFDMNNVCMNQELWEGLPADIQDAIVEAGKVAEERDFEAHRRADKAYQQQLKDLGLEIYYPTEEERMVFKDKAYMEECWSEHCVPWLDEHYGNGEAKAEEILAALDHIIKTY